MGNMISIAYTHGTNDLDFVKNNKKVPEIDVADFKEEFSSKLTPEIDDQASEEDLIFRKKNFNGGGVPS